MATVGTVATEVLPTLLGEHVVVRRVRAGDTADRLAAGQSPELPRLYGGDPRDQRAFTPADADQGHDRLTREPFAWVIEHQGRCIGTIRLHDEMERAMTPRVPLKAEVGVGPHRMAAKEQLRRLEATASRKTAAGVTSVLDGYLPPAAIAGALRRVLRGGTAWHLRSERPQGNPLCRLLPGGDGETGRVPALTPDDQRLLRLVAQGLTDCEIGAALHKSARTVQRHVGRLTVTVGARSRAHLAAWTTAAGLYRFAPTLEVPGRPTLDEVAARGHGPRREHGT